MTAQTTVAGRGQDARNAGREQEVLGALARALGREAEGVRDLREALIRQRAGVAADSTEAVQASCDDIARILVRLEAERRNRNQLLAALGEPGTPATIESIKAAHGGTLPTLLAEASVALRTEASTTAREATVNRTVLKRIVEAGEAFLQTLFANAAAPDAVYRPGERGDERVPFLLDRKA